MSRNNIQRLLFICFSLIINVACKMESSPLADKIPKLLTKHSNTRIDNYYWLNDRENQKVIDYLNSENNYTSKLLKPTKKLQKQLFNEMKSRIKEDDSSVPYFYNEYWYIKKFEKGKDYPIYTRKYKSLKNSEEILLDVNKLAKGHSFYNIGGISISPDNKKLAYSADTISRRLYTIYFIDLDSGKIYDEKINNTTGSLTWANDNKTVFYSKKDLTTLRVNKIFKHYLGSQPADDEIVYEEKDESFSVGISKSKSEEFLFINSRSTLTSEVRFLNANTPDDKFKVFENRTKGHEYSVSHFKDNFYIITNNDDAKNFKLMKSSINKTKKENWKNVLEQRKNILLEGIEIFNDYLVVIERDSGLVKMNIRTWDNKENYYLPIDGETYSLSIGTNIDFKSKKLRYNFSSLNSPTSVIDFDMSTKSFEIKKKQEITDDKFDESNYITERLWAKSHDNTRVAISIIRHKNTELSQSTPLLLYGYGSYGITLDPYFSSVRLSLLDRGFVYAIAHIRGSEYMGRDWYEDGKLLNKKNTFLDFIFAAKHLITKNYTSSEHIYAMGGSAGGLLMGAVLNLEPELFNGIIAAVPFVDVMTTMLDESIPLTTLEYDEWGNPNNKEYYDYMLSYSPYDNIQNKNYTNLLVTTGLHDSQVQYWEPAKWVAKLRDYNESDNIILLHTNMETGHSGASGRFEALKEVAMEYAFLIGLEKNIF